MSFLMCKGDSHNAYGLGAFDHIEPIFGIYSNNFALKFVFPKY